MRSAANTHRALKQDEAKEKREMNSELLEDVLASDNLAQAWKRVKANKGAPGIDGVTIGDFPDHARAHWPAVRQQIIEGRYQPQAVRRVEIPKADGGKRLLGIPTVMDRVIQQACRPSAYTDIRPDILGVELRFPTRPQCTPGDQAGAATREGRHKHRSGHRPCQVL